MNLISTHGFNFHLLCVRWNYNFNILVNSQMQCSHGIQTQAQKCDVMPFNVDAVYQGGSKFAIETSKQQTAFIGELSAQSSPTSETGHFDVLTHILYYCAYSGLCIWLGSCEDRRLNQSRSTAVIPGWARSEERLSQSELIQTPYFTWT